jgi:hypothetical protein
MNLYRALIDSQSWGSQTKGLGVYNNRPIRNGRSLSVHAEGRALDIGVPVSSDTGDRLYKVLKNAAKALGIQQILWDGKGWRCDRGEFKTSPKVAELHKDHLHIELNRMAASQLKPSEVARALKQTLVSPGIILKKGDKGEAVRTFQIQINKYGYSLTPDGDYGTKTKQAVEDFQERHGLNPDGMVGPKTRDKMAKVLPTPRATPPPPAPPITVDPLEKTDEIKAATDKAMAEQAEAQRRADEIDEPPERIEVKNPAPSWFSKEDMSEAVDDALDRQLESIIDALRAATGRED